MSWNQCCHTLLVSHPAISTAIGSDVCDQSTRSSLLRGTYFSKTILRASVSSSVLVTRRAVPVNMVLLYHAPGYSLQPCGATRDTTGRLNLFHLFAILVS